MKLYLRSPVFNYSPITDNLFVGTMPKNSDDFARLQKEGVKLIINMRAERRITGSPIPTLWVPMLDIFLFPITNKQITPGVKQALKVIKDGGKVYVNCRIGRHRSVLMAACVLVAQGHTPIEAQKLIQQKRPIADFSPQRIPTAIRRFATSL